MKLIVGLGNIGREYENTRHNIGFMVVDELARRLGVSFGKEDRSAYMAEYRAPEKIIIIKPTTYMNLSGNAVRYWMDKLKLPLENLIVVCDDLNLPFGTIRMRKNGSDGGHNGLKNIIQHLGTDAFPRIKVGVGMPEHPDHEMIDWVIGKPTGQEAKTLREALDRAAEAALYLVENGPEKAMNRYN